MKHHEFTFRSIGIVECTENEAPKLDDIGSVSKLCPQGSPKNVKLAKKSTEIQTNKTHFTNENSITKSQEADFIENQKFVISNILSIETYRKGNLHQIGITFETERNISETYYESEELPEKERYAKTESVGSQTSTSFISKAKKLRVKTEEPVKEVQSPVQIEKKQNVNMIQTLGDLNSTLDGLHRSLKFAKTQLKETKYDTFGTQTTLGSIDYLVASENEEEDDEIVDTSNIYMHSPHLNEVLA